MPTSISPLSSLDPTSSTLTTSNSLLGNDATIAAFAMMLAKALMCCRMAQEIKQTAASGKPAVNESPVIENSPLTANQFAPNIATKAYQTSGGWKFDPVYIPAGTKVTTNNTEAAATTSTVTPPTAALQTASPAPGVKQSSTVTPSTAATPSDSLQHLAAFPRPQNDNGRGLHWVPITSSTPAVVERFVDEAKKMKAKWVTLLNEGADPYHNDYLVEKLVSNGIEPVMRVYTSGVQPIPGDLGAMVKHFSAKGVNYFQLYNEPNLTLENDGRQPDVKRYVDLWLPAAKTVIANGGLPGLGALAQNGAIDDMEFLRATLREIKARGEENVLKKSWLAAHNYLGDKTLKDPDGLLSVQQYNTIISGELGYAMPIIGTEGGSFIGGDFTEAKQTQSVVEAMRYMQTAREPYNFAYTYWVIANALGGGHDGAWEQQALFQANHISPIVDALSKT
ncbi:MAG: hypothetical protein AAB571_07810 [Chloroflexota bacterium]